MAKSPVDTSRRRFMKGAVAAGGAGEKPKDRIHGNSLAPEYRVDLDTGELTLNPDQRTAFTICYGCTTQCGVRVRVDNSSDRVLRVSGNPYHPLSADDHLPMRTPVAEALRHA